MKNVYNITSLVGATQYYWDGCDWTLSGDEAFDWFDASYDECQAELEMLLNRNDGMTPVIEVAQRIA